MKNTSPFSVSIDGYTISSASGSLSPAAWNSFDVQNAAGGDWTEANPNATALSEAKPTGSTLLAGGSTLSLGHPFNAAGGTQDLAFNFLIAGDFTLTSGVVLYTPVTPSGDFDADGDVDGVDLLAWQRCLGKTIDATRADGDADHDGDVDGADLAVWRAGFGAAATSASSSVPEPASGALPFAGLAALALCSRRRAAC